MPEDKSNVFGEWFSKTLHAKRMTAIEFHQRAKISRSSVYHYMAGKRVPDDLSLGRIVAALGIEPSELPVFEKKRAGRPANVSAPA